MRRFLTIIAVLTVLAAIPAQGQTTVSAYKKSESVVHIDGANYYIHNVQQGETIYSLARLYETTADDITKSNPLARNGIKAGQVLKIPVPAQETPRKPSRIFDEHIVRAGETAYSIARNYGISLTTLVEDNPELDPTQLSIGQTLKMRKKEIGETQPAEITRQWENYRDAANQVSDEYVYHLVKPGETLYSLSRMFEVPLNVIEEANQLKEGEGLKANSIIRIPSESAAQEENGQETATDTEERIDFGRDRTSPRHTNIPNIAVMLPLETGTSNADFVDFYRGALLAFDDLKAAGHSMNVTLYNTGRSAEKVRGIVTSAGFVNTDLIIGPVYESTMDPAVQFADGYKIPMVSPLAAVKELDSEMLYQMAPDPSTKYDKMRDLFGGGKNIILVSSGTGDDSEFEREITAELHGGNYGRFTIGSGNVTTLIDWNRENVFVVLAGTELGVDKALASISSAYNNASARLSRRADIKIVGSSKWAGYNSNSIDKNLFFKLNVCFITSYYVDRSDHVVAQFEGRFLETYGCFPSRAAYRGYDAAKLFGGALFRHGGSFDYKLGQASEQAPLQTPYRFVQTGDCKRHVNDQWALVSFTNNYDIEVR